MLGCQLLDIRARIAQWQILRCRALPLVAVKRRALPILVSLAGACLVGLLVYGVSAQSASRTLDERVAHEAAPGGARRLPRAADARGGRRGSLAALRGKVVVLNFWASWCEPCQVEAPLLERAQSRLLAARRDRARRHLPGRLAGFAELRAPLPPHLSQPARRRTATFAHSYGTDQLPESFIIDRQGQVVAISRGEIDQAFLDRALALAQSS